MNVAVRAVPVSALALAALLAVPAVRAADAWPAEPVSAAVNLTSVEGPEPNDFYTDLSGVIWNPVTRRLWAVTNGPTDSTSRLWVMREDGLGGFVVDTRDGQRGEWIGFGDLEDVTIANEREEVVYTMIEGAEVIREYDVSVYGVKTLRNEWNTRPYLPLSGNSGAEGIAFVPDEFLAAEGFVDRNGAPRVSHNGMGGLMFVGHQNGGGVFAFDLDRRTGAFDFVGEYRTSATETAALGFDRSSGFLYVWHDASADQLEKCRLASTAVAGQSYRRLDTVRLFAGPDHRNNEGIAFFPADACQDGQRPFFMTIDGGDASSLLEYTQYVEGCEVLTAAKVSSGGPKLRLTWSGGAPPATLRRATDPGFRNSVILVGGQNVTSYDDDVLADGQTYFYRLD